MLDGNQKIGDWLMWWDREYKDIMAQRAQYAVKQRATLFVVITFLAACIWSAIGLIFA